MEELYKIKLPAFEGPLDLLLHLIRENKIDIYDIPISFITGRYLEYIEMMKELNLDIAGEFLVMAATLIHIKSRMLLPVEEQTEEEQMEDPRLELVQRLLQYQAYRDAAWILKEKEDEAQNIVGRAPVEIGQEDAGVEPEATLFDVNLFDLINAFRKILDAAPPEIRTITRQTLTIKDRMTHIISRLEDVSGIRFEELFDGDYTRTDLIVTFLALLELLRTGIARAYQENEFGNIWIINPGKENDNERKD